MSLLFDNYFPDLPPLPTSFLTRDGVKIEPQEDVWHVPSLVGSFRLKYDRLENVSRRMIHCLKLAFVSYLSNNAPSHSLNLYNSFDLFRRSVKKVTSGEIERVELSHILQFRSELNAATMWKLGIVRILLSDMDRLGFGISSRDSINYLRESVIPGNIKGTSIRTRDPHQGAFSDVELLNMQSALNNDFASGHVGLYSYVMSWLLLGYGSRPIQIALLKERDLLISEGQGEKLYALDIPRAKQRGQDLRGDIKTRYCSKQIGQLLERTIEYNRALRAQMNLADGDWPMFMSRVEGKIPGFAYHLTSQQVASKIASTVGQITGLKANTRRFRITLGQRAVDDGKDKFTVAELLDHSDTQNIGVYYEASPAIVTRLDKKLAMELAPLAQAFSGILVGDEHDATRGNDPTSRIYDRSLRDNVDKGLGSCGQMSFCGLVIPYACYTCRHFQPWLDGPHEPFLGTLLAERERMVAEGLSPKIYAIRDRTILAVAEVIRLCSERREGESA